MSRALLSLVITAVLAGCSSLPRDGPTSRAAVSGAVGDETFGGYALVDLTYEVTERVKAVPLRRLDSLALADSAAPTDVIGPGDVLELAIYEPSGALFGPRAANARTGVQSGTQALPGTAVDRDGTIRVPFAGPVPVAGLTASQAADAIRRALIGRVANPQVMVAVAENASNTVTVLGDVRNPGRTPLRLNADRILDVIAEAGGSGRANEDILVAIQRDGRTFSAPLAVITSTFGENVRLMRGDQVNLIYRPRRYSSFGALGQVTEVDMGPGALMLSSALSRVGGLDTNSANVRQVLLFRFERPETAQALGLTQAPTPRGVPVVYRLNLNEAAGFFIGANFAVEAGDILYVPRADSAELRKFFEFVQTVTRVVYDISVTSALNID